ncbi:MAG TPA: hypothetical protein VFM59_04235 [Salinimicrobium sp.]|nr:hypothetical protein [Salinimicrobium sp.]
MKIVLKILFVLILLGIATGFYFRNTGDVVTGDKFIGVSILASSFVLLPLFLYFSWKGKKLEDYTLSDKNIKKMKEKNKDRS